MHYSSFFQRKMREYEKLIKASDDAVIKEVQHILVAVKPDGTIIINGSSNSVNAVVGNQALYSSLQDAMINNRKKDGERLVTTKVYGYSPLPVSPFSPQWKGSSMIRKVLDGMVTTAGYGKYGLKLGQGVPPLGWPVDVAPWEGYVGAARPNTNTKKSLSNQQMTQIIVSMLEAAHLDPATHVIQVENVEGINIDDRANVVNIDDGDNNGDPVVMNDEETVDETGDDMNLGNEDSDTGNIELENSDPGRVSSEENELEPGTDDNLNTIIRERPDKTEASTEENLEKLLVLANDLSEQEEVVDVKKRKRYI